MNLTDINNLLIVRLSSLGDVLLTTPLIRSIKKQYPYINLDFLVRKEYSDLLKLNPHLNKILIYENDKEKIKQLKNKICENDYDGIIDLQNNLRTLLLLKCYGSSVAGFSKRNVDKFLLVHFKVNRLKDSPPIPERYAQTIDGFKLDDEGLELISDRTANEKLQGSENYIGICPGAKHFTKRWLTEYYIELGKLLIENGYKVVLFGGKDDKEICNKIEAELPGSINLCNDNDILQTAADMKRCKVIYCNDSGLMHTASAVGVPVIAFFGSTVKEFGFFPYKCKNLVLENNSLSCRPCTHIGKSRCPKKHFKCMKEITPQFAFEKLKEMINH